MEYFIQFVLVILELVGGFVVSFGSAFILEPEKFPMHISQLNSEFIIKIILFFIIYCIVSFKLWLPSIKFIFNGEYRRQAKQINGKWEAIEFFNNDSNDFNKYDVNIKCKLGIVTGIHFCKDGYAKDKGQKYIIEGKYKDKILVFTWKPTDKLNTEYGTITAQLINGELEGTGSYLEEDQKIRSSTFTAKRMPLQVKLINKDVMAASDTQAKEIKNLQRQNEFKDAELNRANDEKKEIFNKKEILEKRLFEINSIATTLKLNEEKKQLKDELDRINVKLGLDNKIPAQDFFDAMNKGYKTEETKSKFIPTMLPKFEWIDGGGVGDNRTMLWNYEIKLKNIGETVYILKITSDDNYIVKFRPDKILVKNRESHFYVNNITYSQDKKASFEMEIRDENNSFGKIKCVCHIDQRYMEVTTL